MPLYPAAWIPYGSDDDDVIFRSPLTSEASITSPEVGSAVAITELGTGTQTYDAVKGMLTGSSGGWRLNTLTDHEQLDNGMQISMEVERGWLCNNDATYASSGDTLIDDASDEQVLLSALSTSGRRQGFFFRIISNGQFRAFVKNTLVSGATIHSSGKDDFVTVRIGSVGGTVGGSIFLEVDGCLIRHSAANDAAHVEVGKNIYIGSDRGVDSFVQEHYIRNLQICKRAPMFPVHPSLVKVGIISDSLFNSDDVSAGNYKDVSASWTIRRELSKQGVYCGDPTNVAASGSFYFNTTGGATIETTGTFDLADDVAALLAANPQVVIFRGGTNDVISGLTIDDTWDTELKARMTEILAGSSVEKIIIGTIPSIIGDATEDTETARAALRQANAYIKALPAWNSNIYVANVYEALGGEKPQPHTYKGQTSGDNNDLHLSGYGHYLMGKCYAQTLLSAL